MPTYSKHRPTDYPFDHWHSPSPDDVGGSAMEFLQRLRGPAHIFVPGEDASRCRAVVTLLHGNEPSGLFAVYHLLKNGIRPAVNLHCFVANVAAAKEPPGFFFRMLPNQADLKEGTTGLFLSHAPQPSGPESLFQATLRR